MHPHVINSVVLSVVADSMSDLEKQKVALTEKDKGNEVRDHMQR